MILTGNEGNVETSDFRNLECKRLSLGQGNEVIFEMYLPDNLYELFMSDNGLFLIDQARLDLEAINNNPKHRSLDPTDKPAIRTINHMSDALSKIVGGPVAVKGTGKAPSKDSEKLGLQFQSMRGLEIASRISLDEWEQDILEFCPVYGVLRYPTNNAIELQEWLFMKAVVGGIPVVDIDYILNNNEIRRATPKDRKHRKMSGFDPELHPNLYKVLGENFTWEGARRYLYEKGLNCPDLKGTNVLAQGNRYIVIDQEP